MVQQTVKFRNEIPEELKQKKFVCLIMDPTFDKSLKESDYKKLKEWEYWIQITSWYASDYTQRTKSLMKVHHKDICVANDPTLFMESDSADGCGYQYKTQCIPLIC